MALPGPPSQKFGRAAPHDPPRASGHLAWKGHSDRAGRAPLQPSAPRRVLGPSPSGRAGGSWPLPGHSGTTPSPTGHGLLCPSSGEGAASEPTVTPPSAPGDTEGAAGRLTGFNDMDSEPRHLSSLGCDPQSGALRLAPPTHIAHQVRPAGDSVREHSLLGSGGGGGRDGGGPSSKGKRMQPLHTPPGRPGEPGAVGTEGYTAGSRVSSRPAPSKGGLRLRPAALLAPCVRRTECSGCRWMWQ